MTACEARVFEINEVIYDEEGLTIIETLPTLLPEEEPYMTIVEDPNVVTQIVTINTEDPLDAGVHYIQVTGYLDKYTTIRNTDAIIEVKFYKLMADLSIPDYEYTLESDELEIPIPVIRFEP